MNTLECVVLGLILTTIFALWSYVNEQQALEDHESYDDEKKKYK